MIKRVAQRPIATLTAPLQHFTGTQAGAGILLLLATAAALIWANSPWSDSYADFWATPATAGIRGFALEKPLILWINDGLMAIFFFVVGLEIKREVLVGELSSPRAAAFPVAAAIGGMAIPALFFMIFNFGGDYRDGWAIPMATDIAFALGVLALIGSRAPLSLKIFLTALAIVDDLGAILVIAFFFTEELGTTALLAAGGFFVVMILANRLGVRHPVVYFLLSVGLWVAFLKSGIHPTLAGVVAAMTIPATRLADGEQFLDRVRRYTRKFEDTFGLSGRKAESERQDAVYGLESSLQDVQSPMLRLEHALNPWVAFGIMPLFAFANAGVSLGSGLGSAIGSSLFAGVFAGLLVGKPVGIVLASWLAVRFNVAEMPAGLTWTKILGVGMLAGIGFTMSLFISGLAFADPAIVDRAKIGILAASVAAGVAGWLLVYRSNRPTAAEPEESATS